MIFWKILGYKNVTLVDFKLEFGTHNGEVLLGDEISPDTCRFWDATTGEKLDKDRFRRDLGNIEEAYKKCYSVLLANAPKGAQWTTILFLINGMKSVNCIWHVYDRTVDVARYVYWGLFALQHRGQESAGIAVTDGHDVELKKVWACWLRPLKNCHPYQTIWGLVMCGNLQQVPIIRAIFNRW